MNKTYVEKLGYELPEVITWDFMYEVAEKAMENGQPIPDQFMEPEKTDTWQRGVKNIFIGVGIAVLFYCFGFESLAGIGWLVAICGVGQAVIGKASQRRNNNDIKPFN